MSKNKAKRAVLFTHQDDDEGPWTVTVDGKVVIDELRNKEMDVADNALEPLWEALGITVDFDEPA